MVVVNRNDCIHGEADDTCQLSLTTPLGFLGPLALLQLLLQFLVSRFQF